MRILIGYASVHGLTATLAEHLPVGPAEGGHTAAVVELRPVQQTFDYEAFVLGSAPHPGAWPPRATDFARLRRDTLGTRPGLPFGVGMPSAAQLPGPRAPIRSREHLGLPGALHQPGLPPTGRLWEAFVAELSRGLRADASRNHGTPQDRDRSAPEKGNKDRRTPRDGSEKTKQS
ncbi:hypothetical protein ACIOKD_06765 [Streptomyces sp. NPDC087844]|uniref:hypothetical protein n=1 Tax=Streptomyces sp. NPDC087844 TaxID=3365805 RepID=UPI0037FE054F